MARTKLKKLREVRELPCVFSVDENVEEKLRKYFGNDHSVSLEIGCGHGDYSFELGSTFPERNFIGIDIKGNRIWTAAKKVLEVELKNVVFIISRAENLISIFRNRKIEEIFIPFPDPHIKRKSESKRLISPHFLKIYKNILKTEGKIHFKTDNDFLFNYFINEVILQNNLNIIDLSNDLYSSDNLEEVKQVKTFYEKSYLEEGRKIKYASFNFNNK